MMAILIFILYGSDNARPSVVISESASSLTSGE